MLYAEEGGVGPDLLVLLHGLGATGAVWRPALDAVAAHWSGRWLALDLPGHGGSERLAGGYRTGQTAAAVAQAIRTRAAGGRLVVLGHSLGGVIGLALASGWFAVSPNRVLALGVKCSWPDSDVAAMAELAARPAKQFADAAGAWARYLKVSGLQGLAQAGSPLLSRGVTEDAGAWRLSMDPEANDAGIPPLRALISSAACPVHLARGATDAIVSLDQLRALQSSAVDLGPGGHNVMVESPQRVWAWFDRAEAGAGVRSL
jgi:pimeloyl-ACP methyl ester carboxylesterase